MTNQDTSHRLNYVGQIEDLIPEHTRFTDPFLFYLPKFLTDPQFNNLNAEKALDFARIAVSYDKPEIVKDALKILNKLVDEKNGSLKPSSRDIFYENRHFTWKELGKFSANRDIIMHVLNKTLFVLTIGKT